MTGGDAELYRGFLADRGLLCLSRVRRGLLLVLVLVGFSSVTLAASSRGDAAGLSLYAAIMAALCAAGWWLSGQPVAQRIGAPVAVLLVVVLGLGLVCRARLFGDPPGVLLQGVTLTMVGSALLVPWGAASQAALSLLLSVIFLVGTPGDPSGTTHLADVVNAIVAANVLSVAGAWFHDRQRLETCIERAQAVRLSGLQTELFQATRRLAETLDEGELCARICRVAAELGGCDQASLTLFDEDGRSSRVRAIDGPRRLRIQEMLDVPVPVPEEFQLELGRSPSTDVPGENEFFDGSVLPVMRRFGVGRSLFVPLRRGDGLLGYLNLDMADPRPAFPAEARRTLEVLAQQATIALSNARLVRELRAASAAKTDFVAMMSHELRTPLNVILGYAEILADAVAGLEDPDAAGSVDRLRRAAEQQLHLVERTLELNRLESGRDHPVLAPVALAALWRDLGSELADVSRVSADRAATLELRWGPCPDVTIRTDRRRLEIVLRNLVGNALKFTPSGEVRAEVEVRGSDVVLRVRDTGLGIEPHRLEGIFNMFEQIERGERASQAGVGLGLYLVRRYVEQLGGTVRVESEPGRGTTFSVELPGVVIPGARTAS